MDRQFLLWSLFLQGIAQLSSPFRLRAQCPKSGGILIFPDLALSIRCFELIFGLPFPLPGMSKPAASSLWLLELKQPHPHPYSQTRSMTSPFPLPSLHILWPLMLIYWHAYYLSSSTEIQSPSHRVLQLLWSRGCQTVLPTQPPSFCAIIWCSPQDSSIHRLLSLPYGFAFYLSGFLVTSTTI